MITLSSKTRHTTRSGREVVISPIGSDRIDELFWLFSDVVAKGDGYPHTPPLTRSGFEETWVRPVSLVVGAVVDDNLVGAYYLKPNQPGLGAHIANAGYVVDGAWRGQGLGARLVQDSVDRAPLVGFDAIQFNFVFASNPARAMYERLGWTEIGRVPRALVASGEDAIVYWRAVAAPD